ncbi:hypothetical protein E1264_20515 [Actinomadura sp. KC216]|uniref:hypothetical protein n=1 Tax=Actinomadura sp. KC216 TaxID=2530370 RepID=UPI0010439F31|nr:hypothetical protein [Actinomadura sp. KC216]TDB85633.1 hypothetical protein E1264_20515 [Actinomadura sp. KC216]
MADERDEPQDREPPSWRLRRWAAPVALAVSVAASIGAVQLLAGDSASSGGWPGGREPRFVLSVGSVPTVSQPQGGPEPWIRIEAFRRDGRYRPVGSVPPPSPSAGTAREIVGGPGGTFVVASTRDEPCETRLYRFTLTGGGRATGIAPLTPDAVPARAGGLAMSPDGDRLAYTTAPCADGEGSAAPPRGASVTVLDIGSGRRRTWSTPGPALVSQIVWAEDDRTLGYVISDIRPDATPGIDVGSGGPGKPSGHDVGNATVHALDTEARGADLRAGRVLFRQRDAAAVLTSAVMGLDGRSGYGVLRKDAPESTVFFDFEEGEPMRVTRTITPKRTEAVSQGMVVLVSHDPPRYACLAGVDPFGRAIGGDLSESDDIPLCGTAYAY